jgi:chromosome partitioning protein
MTMMIGVVSQKGGVGKSTLARMIACEYAAAGWTVKIADMDVSQSTSFHWHGRRLQRGVQPEVAVERFNRIESVLRQAPHYDLVVFDGAPHATAMTLQIAQSSDLTVLPTGIALDDLEPTVRLAHELTYKGVRKEAVVLALCRVGDSVAEVSEAQRYIADAGYAVLDGALVERTAYRRASDGGKAVTETPFASLNEKAGEMMQAIVNRAKQLTIQNTKEPIHATSAH